MITDNSLKVFLPLVAIKEEPDTGHILNLNLSIEKTTGFLIKIDGNLAFSCLIKDQLLRLIKILNFHKLELSFLDSYTICIFSPPLPYLIGEIESASLSLLIFLKELRNFHHGLTNIIQVPFATGYVQGDGIICSVRGESEKTMAVFNLDQRYRFYTASDYPHIKNIW
jgi:hypothetical protein